jgi:hypothetical protein
MEGGIFRSNLTNFAISTSGGMAGPLDDWAVRVDTNAAGECGFRRQFRQADEEPQ